MKTCFLLVAATAFASARGSPVLLVKILIYSFASVFSTHKYEFGELNSGFSVRVYTGSIRDAAIST
jgi:hypothetical protein